MLGILIAWSWKFRRRPAKIFGWSGVVRLPAPSDYAILLCPLCAGGWRRDLAVVSDLPGCLADGDTPEQAFTNAQDAIESWIATAITMKRPIPDPSPSHPELLIDSRRTPH